MRPPSGVRPPPRDVVELRALAAREPDLAQAAELHAELVSSIRRVELRLTTPIPDLSADLLASRLARGVPLAAFGEFPVDWMEVRLLIRQVTELLRHRGFVEADGAQRLQTAGRDQSLIERARVWYEAPQQTGAADGGDDPDPLWPEVLQWSLRPFLVRTAEVLSRRANFEGWQRGSCPICGAEPEFGVLSGSELHLLCGRCHTRWPFDQGCPFCGQRDPGRRRTLATKDRLYRLTECLDCGRYVKALDSQVAGRPLLPYYDPVATLPLDAAMMKQGGQ